MKYLNRIQRPDGRVFLYLRKKGLPSVRLPEGLSGEALARHVADLMRELSPEVPVIPSTLAAALRAYELESADFRALAASTQYEYRLILKEFDEDLGRLAVAAFTPAFVDRLKATWARRGHRAANIRLQLLKNVLKPSLVAGELASDPFPLVGQVPRPRALREPHLIWSDEVLGTVMGAALAAGKHGLARALAIGRYVGARRGDLVAIGRMARQDGRFRYMSGKRRVWVDVPEDPELARWLDATPDAPPERPRRGRKLKAGQTAVTPTTLVYSLTGRPYTEDGLALELRKLVSALHRSGALDSDRYDLHGLRHTRGVELALAGCSDAEGAAMMGHGSASSFVQYRRQADRVRLANAAAARVSRLREEVADEKCKTEGQQSANSTARNGKGPDECPALSVSCDGTASPDRTGDLQSHNLAL